MRLPSYSLALAFSPRHRQPKQKKIIDSNVFSSRNVRMSTLFFFFFPEFSSKLMYHNLIRLKIIEFNVFSSKNATYDNTFFFRI
jgi:hypothetical protein